MVANESFFQRQQAAAVLKHGILKRYPRVFATMAGSMTGRVVYFDGYAGPGRYADGAPGSPIIAVETAQATSTWDRDVECLFVEKNPLFAANLARTLAAEAPKSMKYSVWTGDVSDYVDRALEVAGGDPMFTLLDPFGTGLSYAALTGKLLGRTRHQATEVMLNLNLENVWRTGGWLTGEVQAPGSEKALGRLDAFFGDSWWRDEFRQARRTGDKASAADAAAAVATEFQRRVLATTGFQSFAVEVRRRPGQKPLFLMLLFFRHWKAPWKFNDAVSSANGEWREACWQQDMDGIEAEFANEDLFGELTGEFMRNAEEASWRKGQTQIEAAWVRVIEQNLLGLLVGHSRVQLGHHVREVYGSTLSLARDTHVRQAWDALAAAGGAAPRDKSVRRLEEALLSRPFG